MGEPGQSAARGRLTALLAAFSLSIALGSFLLFLVQPLIGRFILPWFGATPAVWTTCMLAFQTLLLAGYAYAHALTRSTSPKKQVMIHGGLLLISLAVFPIIPGDAWKPTSTLRPTLQITLLLAATVGLPFLALSAGAPLLQHWHARTIPGRSPYRLYALSNLGSLGALLAYPLVFELLWGAVTQAWIWSAAYLIYVAAFLGCAALVWRSAPTWPIEPVYPATAALAAEATPRPRLGGLALWIALSACGCALLLATTQQMCQDVAVIPFLWVLPLAIYLITFVLTFDSDRWYPRRLYLALLPVALAIGCVVLFIGVNLGIVWQVAGYSVTLFVCCMVCHGELVRARPGPRHLTLFYLLIATGGALGSVLVAIVAPLALDGLHDYALTLLACYGLIFVAARDRKARGLRARLTLAAWITGAVLLGGSLGTHMAGWEIYDDDEDGLLWGKGLRRSKVLVELRNFYGVVRVTQGGSGTYQLRYLEHGRIMHGKQFTDRKKRALPTSYYGPDTGVGVAMRLHPKRAGGGVMRIGVIGLGTGTIAAYTRGGDYLRFYEINPYVYGLASTFFTFLEDAENRGVDLDVVLGDARIRLERQLQADQPQRFDVLVLDAFSSDAIPIHLLTRESAAIYDRHLDGAGIIAINISNRYLNLKPVVAGLAAGLDMYALLYDTTDDDDNEVDGADWVLLTRNASFLDHDDVYEAVSEDLADGDAILWTDDFSSVYGILEQ